MFSRCHRPFQYSYYTSVASDGSAVPASSRLCQCHSRQVTSGGMQMPLAIGGADSAHPAPPSAGVEATPCTRGCRVTFPSLRMANTTGARLTSAEKRHRWLLAKACELPFTGTNLRETSQMLLLQLQFCYFDMYALFHAISMGSHGFFRCPKEMAPDCFNSESFWMVDGIFGDDFVTPPEKAKKSLKDPQRPSMPHTFKATVSSHFPRLPTMIRSFPWSV